MVVADYDHVFETFVTDSAYRMFCKRIGLWLFHGRYPAMTGLATGTMESITKEELDWPETYESKYKS